MKSLKWIDSPLAPAIVIAICYIAFFLRLLETRKGDVSLFVIAGGDNVDASKTPPGLTVIPKIGGYDGIWFYRLAINPFTRVQAAHGIRIDNPPYRQQRIGYPFIVWMLSLGRVTWIPWLLVIVNIIAAAAMAAFAGAFAKKFGLHALWGVIVPLYPGFVLTFSRDLSEIVAAAFATGAIWAAASRRNIVAALLLTAAVLTRETTLLLAAALAAVWLIDRILRRERRVGAITFSLPIAVYAFWQIVLAMQWGVTPLRAGAPDRALPFVEYARFLAAASFRRNQQERHYFLESFFLAAVSITIVLVWRRSRAPLEWRLAWLGYLALFAILPHTIWLEDFGFLRIFADVFLVSAALIIPSNASARWFTLLTTAGLWYYLAKDLVRLG
ncbi:MAG TPA: hypothetical protein VGQ21_01840 [Thermoanaerobaculia bacterium]|jgi:hypothetical protein|nr:hypothetical protein [Thermoanaerobaculia bacterium]